MANYKTNGAASPAQEGIADLTETAELFAALSDPSRLRILGILAQGETCVCDITAPIGLAPSTISKHLELLRHAGLIAAAQTTVPSKTDGTAIHRDVTEETHPIPKKNPPPASAEKP